MGRRKKGGGGGEDCGSWMDTYGDMVTLLLCFFVMLYSMSNLDQQKWEVFVKSIFPTLMIWNRLQLMKISLKASLMYQVVWRWNKNLNWKQNWKIYIWFW